MRKFLPFVGLASFAFAHPGHFHGVNPFNSGLIHPLTGLDHLSVMVAVGLLGSYYAGKKAFLPALTFVSFMTLGSILGLLGVSVPFVESGIILSVALMGILLFAKDLKLSYVLPLIGIFGILHGVAHGYEAPQTLHPVYYVLGFVLSTAALHFTGLLFGKALKEKLVRVSGLLLLALAFLL
ncbi:HupE/UreJ family protein [Aquifex aeolicus]|uniref:HupE hydrogenase related function n=1 Tax=Aquifex aeolicus (strain VF5) TaxID=224324 RepID=O66897_AQUAE|nr:HupE/UreJ family protein [Aquifex aeolicus]AAC06859.1 HupE hydrogenase related function [Aquifex aeolicus VF5]